MTADEGPFVTKTGKVLTNADIERLADEACGCTCGVCANGHSPGQHASDCARNAPA